MTLARRLVVVLAILALAVAGQALLRWHLDSAVGSVYPDLNRPLEDFPFELAATTPPPDSALVVVAPTGWVGRTSPHIEELRKKLDFEVNGLVSRQYVSRAQGIPVGLYMVYSRSADDRKHHPEVCIRDAGGSSEDLAGRQLVPLDASQERLAQRLRFHTRIGETTTVYYWHYSLEAEDDPALTKLQRFHQKVSQSAPSITVQVSSTAPPAELDAVEKEFLPLIDSVMKDNFLPSRTRVGCNRIPVGVVRE